MTIETIADKLTNLNTIKNNIKNAIVQKGVDVSDADTFASYAQKIAEISTQSQDTQQLTGLIEADITSLEIPDGCTKIGTRGLYYKSSLSTVSIPDTVTSIGISAFGYCTGLTGITIPAGVTSIASNAFAGCSALETITINQSENNIAGAPWGADDTVTIVWNG